MRPQPSMNVSPLIRIPVSPVAVSDAGGRLEQWTSLLAGTFPAGPWYERSDSSGTRTDEEYERMKRLLDLAISLALLPFVIFVLALCALAIKLESPGPAMFTQLRTGKGGRRFRMYKLRTMVRNAEELKAQLMHLNELTYPDFKITNDPRVTRVGWFLRKTSLDELPQLLNVVRGDMSLVGPRPTSFSAGTYSLWHTARLEVKPGLTGLWQILGRSSLDFDDRLRLDIAYVRNRSLWLDVRILFRTARAVLDGKGAS
jgi:lipopolysaccharide/colanic/teichoic acid biosynthesis glycosyltransferase